MKYHEFPSIFNWDAMEDDNATATTAYFIFDLAERIDVNYGIEETGAGIDDMRNALISYGYSTNIISVNHNIDLVRNELNNRRPVCMTGKSDDGGHAWVASGYNIIRSHIDYKLYVPVQNASMGSPYVNIEDYLGEQTNSVYFYMNWGWGTCNGLYNDYDLGDYTTVNWAGLNVAFNDDRKDLINIIPGI
jgi:hypothetical protein